MPLERIIVRHNREEKRFTPQEYLDWLKERPSGHPYTYEVMAVLLGGQQNRGDHLSTTALLSECDRNLVLERKEPYDDTVEHLWAAFTGTMFHEQLEKVSISDQTVVETRYWIELPNVGWLSCKPDLIDVKYGTLEDFKSKDKLPSLMRSNPYDTNVEQVQINRFIVQHAEWVEDPDGTEVIYPYHNVPTEAVKVRRPADGKDRPYEFIDLAVVYIAPREGMVRMRCTKSIDVPTKDGKGTKKQRVSDIWSDEDVLELVTERYTNKRNALDAYEATGDLPPIPDGWEGQTGWLCDYCPVRRQCAVAYFEGR